MHPTNQAIDIKWAKYIKWTPTIRTIGGNREKIRKSESKGRESASNGRKSTENEHQHQMAENNHLMGNQYQEAENHDNLQLMYFVTFVTFRLFNVEFYLCSTHRNLTRISALLHWFRRTRSGNFAETDPFFKDLFQHVCRNTNFSNMPRDL